MRASKNFPGNVVWTERPQRRPRTFAPEPLRSKSENDLGSALVMVVAERSRRTLLVTEIGRKDPLKKLPGGCREPGETMKAAAIREAFDEVGVVILEDQLTLLSDEGWIDGRHLPALYLASIAERQFDLHLDYGDENGDLLVVDEVLVDDLLSLRDLLSAHRRRIKHVFPAAS